MRTIPLKGEERTMKDHSVVLDDYVVLEAERLETACILDAATSPKGLKAPFEIQHIISVSPSECYELHRETYTEDGYRLQSDKPWHECLVARGFREGDKVAVILCDAEGAVLRDEYEL
jgi:hypothetical protein